MTISPGFPGEPGDHSRRGQLPRCPPDQDAVGVGAELGTVARQAPTVAADSRLATARRTGTTNAALLSTTNGSDLLADERPQLHDALLPNLSHPRSAAYRWLRPNGKGQPCPFFQAAELCGRAALSWTCSTARRIIGVARWIDRLTRCPGP